MESIAYTQTLDNIFIKSCFFFSDQFNFKMKDFILVALVHNVCKKREFINNVLCWLYYNICIVDSGIVYRHNCV